MLALLVTAISSLARPAAHLSRRAAVASIGSALLVAPRAAVSDDEPPPSFTKGDAFQLRASYNGLGDALNAWAVETAQVQLGNEPSSVVAVAGFNDLQLDRLSQASSVSAESIKSFKMSRDLLLQNLYLARGASRYEKDPAVARKYIETARLAGLAAQSDLEAVASAAGIDLTRKKPPPSAAAPEDAIVFTPRAAPKVENRLVF
jgi:hypothetical protein